MDEDVILYDYLARELLGAETLSSQIWRLRFLANLFGQRAGNVAVYLCQDRLFYSFIVISNSYTPTHSFTYAIAESLFLLFWGWQSNERYDDVPS